MSLIFLLDENMPFALVEWLSKCNYQVTHLKMIGKGGIKNGEVYKLAEAENAWILTRDADFKSYQKFIIHSVPGIIVFQLTDTRTQNMLETMKHFLEQFADKLSARRLIFIDDHDVKIYEA